MKKPVLGARRIENMGRFGPWRARLAVDVLKCLNFLCKYAEATTDVHP
jgi:hypothetical protein